MKLLHSNCSKKFPNEPRTSHERVAANSAPADYYASQISPLQFPVGSSQTTRTSQHPRNRAQPNYRALNLEKEVIEESLPGMETLAAAAKWARERGGEGEARKEAVGERRSAMVAELRMWPAGPLERLTVPGWLDKPEGRKRGWLCGPHAIDRAHARDNSFSSFFF